MSPEKREISRNPDTPELSRETIECLTSLCFRSDNSLEPVDLLFLFGTSPSDTYSDLVRQILEDNLTKEVVITGGLPHKKLDDAKVLDLPESSLILNSLNPVEFEGVNFTQENSSTNTLENVTEALRIYDFSDVKKLMFVFKSHAAGRGYLILKTFLPDVEILQKTVPGKYEDSNGILIEVSKDDWFKTDIGRARVWGEFLRMREYGRRGDFDITSVDDSIQKIEQLTNLL